MSRLIGQRVAQYEIIERVGVGGMGEVYLARDTSLDRQTALKFLPADLVNDETARTRLLREARSAAALDHPNICRVYAIGEHERRLFLALEYVDGRTLQQVLRGGILPLERVVAVAVEVCEALKEAHAKGIVHRDLKPSNLMFNAQGKIKVLDFGLAKRHDLAAETDVPLTETGMAIGTIPYMSPEQLNGDELGPASDLFSLGILLYEMIAGRHPFGRKVNMETAMTILTKQPPALRRPGEDVPPHLAKLVDALLRKQASDRPQGAQEVLDILQSEEVISSAANRVLHDAATMVAPRPETGDRSPVTVDAAIGPLRPSRSRPSASRPSSIPSGSPSSIAVLPFARLSPDPEDEYFADGLSDEITSALARLRPIRVVARTSAFAFKDRNEDVRVIGRQLGADTLLQGSIRRSGPRVRIGVQLVSAFDGSYLWSETYDRELTDVFAVQDEISQSVVSTLRLQLGSGSIRALAIPRTDNLEAYQLYLQARHAVRSSTDVGLEQGLRYYTEALQLDPGYAPAMVGSAEAYIFLAFFAVMPTAEAYPKAKELVERALSLDPGVDNARGVMSSIRSNWEWDFEGAEKELRAALVQAPNDAAAHYTLAVLMSNLSRHQEAIDAAREADRLDPLNSTVGAQLGFVLHHARQEDAAEAHFRTMLQRHPADAMIPLGLAVVLRSQGRYEEAVQVVESAPKAMGGVGEATLATCYPRLGREAEARAILGGFEAATTDEVALAYVRAAIHVALDEHERAIDLLEQAADLREALVLTIGVQDSWEPLHGHERFRALRQRIGI